jgi:hypothetical protein
MSTSDNNVVLMLREQPVSPEVQRDRKLMSEALMLTLRLRELAEMTTTKEGRDYIVSRTMRIADDILDRAKHQPRTETPHPLPRRFRLDHADAA